LHLRFPGLPILMLTVHGDDDSIFGAVCAGACGYLLKETEPRRLLDTIREIHTGGAPMSPEIARRVAPRWTSFAAPDAHPVASGGGPQLQELRPRTGTERRHRSPPRAPHLRPAARPFPLRSRLEGVWRQRFPNRPLSKIAGRPASRSWYRRYSLDVYVASGVACGRSTLEKPKRRLMWRLNP